MTEESSLIKINKWLLPFSWLYGLGACFRNKMFDVGLLKSRTFDIPIISVGNITVGGTGKTPHVEYLVSLLSQYFKTAVLSRGYKRKSHGYILAESKTPMNEIGDEPYQIKNKFENIYVAVAEKRCEGIDRITSDAATNDVEAIVLDDAYQHRYVKPGINILLIDYNRPINKDRLLPAGRLREPKNGTSRADIVIVTKCPDSMKPMEYRVIKSAISLNAHQDIFFTSIEYCDLKPLFKTRCASTDPVDKTATVLLLTGIVSPMPIYDYLLKRFASITTLSFPDHHYFTRNDIERINNAYNGISGLKMIITTEKDAARLERAEGLSDGVIANLYVLPIKIKFLLGGEKQFNNKIISYVRQNSRNSIMAETANDNKSTDSHNLRNGVRTISFRNN